MKAQFYNGNFVGTVIFVPYQPVASRLRKQIVYSII